MSKFPMQYLNENYLEPLNVSQDDLCKMLDLGKRTVNELFTNKRGFTVNTASKFGKLLDIPPKKILELQSDYDLKNCEIDTNNIKSLEPKKEVKKMLELLQLNSFSQLHTLFKTDEYLNYQEQIKILFNDIPLSTTIKYMQESKTGLSHLKKLYSFYIKQLNGKAHKEFESIFLDSELQVVEKACNYEKYFTNTREFEKYLFYRFLFFKNRYYFLKKQEDTKAYQRALYLYEFLTYKEVNIDVIDVEPISLFGNRKIRKHMKPDKFGLVDGLEKRRFEQLKETGVF